MKAYLNELSAELGISGETLDPAHMAHKSEGQIDGHGLHNTAIMYRTKRAVYNQRLLAELLQLRDKWDIASTTAASFIVKAPEKDLLHKQQHPPLSEPLPINAAQRSALISAMSRPLTIVTGPPGTGKSQLVAAIAASCWMANQSVLVASTNNQAVDVAVSRSALSDPGILIRTGSKEHRDRAREDLRTLARRRDTFPEEALLVKALETSRTMARETHELVRQRTSAETKLAEVSLGLELVSAPFEASDLSTVRQDISRAHRRATRLEKSRWLVLRRKRRMLRSLGLADHDWSEVLTYLEVAERDQGIRRQLVDLPSMHELYRNHIDNLSHLNSTSSTAVRATIARSMQAGSREVAHFSWATPSYDDLDALQTAFSRVLPYVKGWASTALSAGATFPLHPQLFDLVVIDEASQCSIPNVLPLLFRAKRAVIIGDPNQLQHISTLSRQSDDSAARSSTLDPADLAKNRSSYSRASCYLNLEGKVKDVHLLDEHYRSHPDIIGLSNKLFYGGALSVLTNPANLSVRRVSAVTWIHSSGKCHRPSSGSLVNPFEAQALVSELTAFVQQDSKATVGVVTPFSAQSRLIANQLEQTLTEDQRRRVELMVGTAHRFQGDERDVIFFSPVAGPGVKESTLSWMTGTPNLLNVAITRARSYLVVVGDEDFCCETKGALGDFARSVRDLEIEEKVEQRSYDGKLHSEAERRLYEAFVRRGVDPYLKPRVCGYECDFLLETGSKTALNIECDGQQHLDNAARQRIQDETRDALLRLQGIGVIRMPAWRCLAEPDKVVSEILDTLEPATESGTVS